MHTVWFAAACLLLAASPWNPALASDDEAAVRDAIGDNYAAYSGFDEARHRATTTDDFLLLERGKLIDRGGDVAGMPKPGIGFRRTDHFEFDAVRLALLHSTPVSHPAGAADMKQFAVRYAAAWCSQDPARVAAFFALDASLTINGGTPHVGRAAITDAARSFMTAYPDMVVEMDCIERAGDGYQFHWTFTGTHTGPGGTGRKVRISGYEEWSIGADGLIARSLGHYDQADWDRQLGKPTT
jgi:uncharacterized protein (TIGR02246 family)